jgi:hypothetical protein
VVNDKSRKRESAREFPEPIVALCGQSDVAYPRWPFHNPGIRSLRQTMSTQGMPPGLVR